jgi:hypothetical protein
MAFKDVELFGWKLIDSSIKVMINLAITFSLYLLISRIFHLNTSWSIGVFFLISIIMGQIIMTLIKENLGYKIRKWMFYRNDTAN